jgi:peptide/nickel transport system substrate-binding protein
MPLRPTARSRRALSLAAAGLIALTAACSGSSETTPTAGGVAAPERGNSRGGTLNALALGPVLAWDPQRLASRDDIAFASRVFLRTLTSYAPSTDPAQQSRLVGDLATDTGHPNDTLTEWTFTLRDQVAWEDGKPITCEDVKYGISRTFATDVITGGATDALSLLAVPKQPDGRSVYLGPYATGAAATAGQKAFDDAVTCSGSAITFKLSAPTSDFNEVVSQPAFAPYPQARDKQGSSAYDVVSSGPYRLEGVWKAAEGGRFVRNPAWKPASDPIRKAYPNEIRYEEGLETQAVAQQIISGSGPGKSAVSLGSAPPAIQQQITAVPALRERSVNPLTGLVDYLVPNFASPAFAKPEVALALATATNRNGYVTALGGENAAAPSTSVVPGAVRAVPAGDPVGAGLGGDPAKAKAMLTGAGVTTPVPIRVAYRSSPAADKAMSALVTSWRDAGFAPELKPIPSDYFTVITQPAAAKAYDVFWSNWAPAWASASTVLPALFDSTINLTPAGPGRDYGYFKDAAVSTSFADTAKIADRAAREKAWADIDTGLVKRGVYIALAERRALYIAGTDVQNLSANQVLGGFVDLADIAVQQ